MSAPPPPTEAPPVYYKYTGVGLAITSAIITGSSFIFKKKGLLAANHIEEDRAGVSNRPKDVDDNHAYLKQWMWWLGMLMMALGEVMNFVAYAFAPAVLVSPLGGVSVVVSTVLSTYILKETLDTAGWIGCVQCLLGATIVVIYAPETISTQTIHQFFSYFVYPGFLVYFFVCIGILVFLVLYLAPRQGKKSPLVYISITSIGGGLLALSAQGWGSSIVYTINGHWNTDNQALCWQWYILGLFTIGMIVFQINYLNKALNNFSTAVVTPVYYVTFTTCVIITSLVFFRGGATTNTAPIDIVSAVLGFFVICGGVAQLYIFNRSASERLVSRTLSSQSIGTTTTLAPQNTALLEISPQTLPPPVPEMELRRHASAPIVATDRQIAQRKVTWHESPDHLLGEGPNPYFDMPTSPRVPSPGAPSPRAVSPALPLSSLTSAIFAGALQQPLRTQALTPLALPVAISRQESVASVSSRESKREGLQDIVAARSMSSRSMRVRAAARAVEQTVPPPPLAAYENEIERV